MMKKELKEKFEELRDAIVKLDTEKNVCDVRFDRESKLMEIHVFNCGFPAHYKCDEQFVWLGGKNYPWRKQVIINGVVYYDLISQEQFEKEHATEVA